MVYSNRPILGLANGAVLLHFVHERVGVDAGGAHVHHVGVEVLRAVRDELDDFVDKSLHYSDAKIVILGLVFVIYAA